MLKKLNGFLLTRKLNHQCLVKLLSFSSSKFRCMHEHVRPNVRDFNLARIILYCGTNDVGSQRTACQIARSTIEIAHLLNLSLIKYLYPLLYQEMTILITKPVK